jgi:hypothetical protein
MSLRIVTADERLAAAQTRGTIAIFGQYGVGKTSLLYTLPAAETLALDFEGGFKSVQTWQGDSIEIRSYAEAADVACLVGGPNPSIGEMDFFSPQHYEACLKRYPTIDMRRYRHIFFDSISELTVVAAERAKQANQWVDPKTGEMKMDTRGMYGDLGRETMAMLRHMQHAAGKNVIFVGRLEQIQNEAKQLIWQPQLEGQKVGRELPGIVDQVISMSHFDYVANTWIHNPGKGAIRAFVCTTQNPWGLPAKERTLGNVGMIEEPHLGKLLAKINQPATAEAASRLAFNIDKPKA